MYVKLEEYVMGIVNTERENLLERVAYNYDKARNLDLKDPILFALGETLGEAIAAMESNTQEIEAPEESEDGTIHSCRTCKHHNVTVRDTSHTEYHSCDKGVRSECTSTLFLDGHCKLWEG